MTDLLIEPTSRRETYLAQEANKVNGFEIVAALSTPGYVAGTVIDGVTQTGPKIGNAAAVGGGELILDKSANFSSATWTPSPDPTDVTSAGYLDGKYTVTFLAARDDANYLVFITGVEDLNGQGYQVVPRISNKTVDGFEYQFFIGPNGSANGTTSVTEGSPSMLDINLADLPDNAGIAQYSSQYQHDLMVMDF